MLQQSEMQDVNNKVPEKNYVMIAVDV